MNNVDISEIIDIRGQALRNKSVRTFKKRIARILGTDLFLTAVFDFTEEQEDIEDILAYAYEYKYGEGTNSIISNQIVWSGKELLGVHVKLQGANDSIRRRPDLDIKRGLR